MKKYVICVNIQIHLLINLCAEDLKISLFLTMCLEFPQTVVLK